MQGMERRALQGLTGIAQTNVLRQNQGAAMSSPTPRMPPLSSDLKDSPPTGVERNAGLAAYPFGEAAATDPAAPDAYFPECLLPRGPFA
jgi:hypothetical protein